jgi:hypothetical protein
LEKAIACCKLKTHGATIRLIGAMIATVASCCFDEPAFPKMAIAWLDELRNQLPAARSNMEILRTILASPSPEQIYAALDALPFNYH